MFVLTALIVKGFGIFGLSKATLLKKRSLGTSWLELSSYLFMANQNPGLQASRVLLQIRRLTTKLFSAF
jgi:hypothetical protein